MPLHVLGCGLSVFHLRLVGLGENRSGRGRRCRASHHLQVTVTAVHRGAQLGARDRRGSTSNPGGWLCPPAGPGHLRGAALSATVSGFPASDVVRARLVFWSEGMDSPAPARCQGSCFLGKEQALGKQQKQVEERSSGRGRSRARERRSHPRSAPVTRPFAHVSWFPSRRTVTSPSEGAA